MAQRKEERRRNMSIFQGLLTQRWAILVKSLRDVQMASLSNPITLGKAISLPDGQFGPIGSPFGRLKGVSNGF